MPIHLLSHDDPAPGRIGISRRGFLAGTAGAVAGLFLPSGSRSFAAPVARGTWALLADTHIQASEATKAHGNVMATNLRAVLEEVIASSPHAAVIDGDLALATGQSGDYETLNRLLGPVRAAGIHLHFTLGNHDDRENFTDVLRLSGERPVVGKHASSVLDGDVHWLFLDSLERVNSTPGLLGRRQLEWIARRLDAHPEVPALLYLHHNPEQAGSGLKDTTDLLEVIVPRVQAKAVFFGHTHTWRHWTLSGLHLVNLPAVAYAFNDREPLGWVRATLDGAGLELELRALDKEHPQHGQRRRLSWRTTAPRAVETL